MQQTAPPPSKRRRLSMQAPSRGPARKMDAIKDTSEYDNEISDQADISQHPNGTE